MSEYINDSSFKAKVKICTLIFILHSRISIPLKYTWNFSSKDHMLSFKMSFHTFKSIEIIKGIFSHHSGIKLEVNNRRKFSEFPNMWKSNM